jgi:hypothetical protein
MRRPVFIIHLDHSVEVSKREHLTRHGSVQISTERELGRFAAQWPSRSLVEIWNQLPNVKALTRFTDRTTAVQRIWAKLQELEHQVQPVPAPFTKAENIIALLKGPSGASLQTIMDLTGWQPHSVRGFISAQISKRMGLKIHSFKRDGARIYRIRP